MTSEELEKKTICELCEKCQYDVFPNKNICTELKNIIDIIVMKEESCPIGKW
jgi:predicted nucleic-acid-binding Zn-ribbon protein